MQTANPCLVMRGGTSRGSFFTAGDLSSDAKGLLAVMGSRERRPIDVPGEAHPLASKVGIVSNSPRALLAGSVTSGIAVVADGTVKTIRDEYPTELDPTNPADGDPRRTAAYCPPADAQRGDDPGVTMVPASIKLAR